MIKNIRRQKLDEIIGKPEPFDPIHYKATHGEDPESPNQYSPKKAINEVLGGTYNKRKRSAFFQKKIPSERDWQKSGQQKMQGRYDEEMNLVSGGKTDTGKSSDTIEVSPRDKNSVNKEINVTKENKEK